MSEFTLHTLDTAPQSSRKLLQQTEKQMGFIPNLFSVMADSPAVMESYQSLIKLFDKTAFTVTERQLVLLSISRFRNCTYCLAAHGMIAKMQKVPAEITHAMYYNQALNDTKLEALRTFTCAILQADGTSIIKHCRLFIRRVINSSMFWMWFWVSVLRHSVTTLIILTIRRLMPNFWRVYLITNTFSQSKHY